MTTIQTKSAHAQYSDCHLPTEVKALNYKGADYVAVEVSPRGFSNELATYVARADDAAAVARLQGMMDKNYSREPGDSYSASWLSPRQLNQHIFSQRANGENGSYLLTLDANGNRDSLVV